MRSLGSPGRLFGSLHRLLTLLGPTFESNLVEKSVFAILVPRLGETTTFEGLAAQVGATWSIKSHPGDARGSRNGGQGSQKGARSGQSGRPVCQSYGTRRKAGQNQVKSEVKVYLSDKSYD